MNLIKFVFITGIVAIATGGFYHGQQHLYNGTIPHAHVNGVVHIH